MSLTDVAVQADISVATLSRIERDKQNVDVATFLLLLRILGVNPGEMLGSETEGVTADGVDPLAVKILALRSQERTQLWRSLADQNKEARRKKREAVHNLSMQVEELLAQIDFVKSEIETVQKRIGMRRR